MGESFRVRPDMPVDTIMRTWPSTVRVMIRRRMLCVGCPVGRFHTVSEACLAHGIEEAGFILELEEAMESGAGASSTSCDILSFDTPDRTT